MADVQIPKAIDIRERIVHLKAELKTLRKLLKIAEQTEARGTLSEDSVFCDKQPPEGLVQAESGPTS